MPSTTMEADQEGVLLYYFYSPLAGRQEAERRWLEKQCTEAQLVGRVRVAQDGLNSTLGGSLPALRAHIAAVQERYAAVGGADIDFKLAASRGSKSAACAAESGFTSLKVQLCKEVVALGAPGGGGGGAPDAARHVSPSEFHALLAAPGEGAVLVDCRNAYETSIGRFEAVRRGWAAHPRALLAAATAPDPGREQTKLSDVCCLGCVCAGGRHAARPRHPHLLRPARLAGGAPGAARGAASAHVLHRRRPLRARLGALALAGRVLQGAGGGAAAR